MMPAKIEDLTKNIAAVGQTYAGVQDNSSKARDERAMLGQVVVHEVFRINGHQTRGEGTLGEFTAKMMRDLVELEARKPALLVDQGWGLPNSSK